MSISDLYQSGTQKNNIAHFAAITNIAAVDGEVNEQEKKLLFNFADKLNINENQFAEIVKDPSRYSIPSVSSKEERLQHIFDLFKMIYADNEIDEQEEKLILKYAIGLGCSSELAKDIIQKSKKIFEGGLDFEDYTYLLDKKA
ncbi:hypothetical protein MTsPCn5_38120 [Croceitalea sp. MTPC5]|uniref:TerB family tellurite resistance protein n=1 Tax=Croceitalea sp. MTPC5 TaxID=3056565 RepID=UPI002B3A6F39|nr:hypothetical protein MTsPCn5_38120 [Croceitalea sp. MTPC5]